MNIKKRVINLAFDLHHMRRQMYAYLKRNHIASNEKYQSLEKYKDIHKGKRCFIVATGPSLTLEDIELIKNEYTFSMNSIIKWFDKTSWRPTYYFIQDIPVYKALIHELEKIDRDSLFISDFLCDKFHILKGNVYPLDYLNHIKNNTDLNIYFSNDVSAIVYDGYTVVYSIIQFAAYMGFKEIFLLGTDCDYSGEKKHAIEHGVELDENLAKNVTERLIFSYKYAKEQLEKEDIAIYNASRGGKLKLFECVNLEDIIK